MSEEVNGAQSDASLEDSLSLDVIKSQFKQFGKENFQSFAGKKPSLQEALRSISRQTALNLPTELNEYFFTLQSAQFFLVSDAPLFLKYEDYLRKVTSGSGMSSGNFVDIKKFFIKWITEKTEREREYYALSALQLIERNTNPNNFLKFVFEALIYTYDRKHFAPEKAEERMEQSFESLDNSSLDSASKSEFQYLLFIYQGVVHFELGDFESARGCFSKAQEVKVGGVTAAGLKALSELKLNKLNSAQMEVEKLYDYDLARFKLAIDNDKKELFTFTLENALLYSLFENDDFALLFDQIKSMIESSKTDEKNVIQQMRMWLINLKALEMDEYFNDRIANEIKFLEQITQQYHNNKNSFLSILSDRLLTKFNAIIDGIKKQVLSVYDKKVEGELVVFNDYINTEEKKIAKTKDDIERQKEQLHEKYDILESRIESNMGDVISDVEEKLNSLDSSKDYDPTQAFQKALINNVAISIAIMVIVGFITAISKGGDPGVGTGDLISVFFTNGLKWGGIIFLLGLIACFGIAMSAAYDGNKEKRNLVQRISQLQSQKEKEIENLKQEFERKEERLVENANKNVNKIIESLDAVKKEKSNKEFDLKQENTREVEKIFETLASIFKK